MSRKPSSRKGWRKDLELQNIVIMTTIMVVAILVILLLPTPVKSW